MGCGVWWKFGVLAIWLAMEASGQVVEINGGPEPEGDLPKELAMKGMEREDMDQLLWQPEVVAQEFEEVINSFWNQLRATPVNERLDVFSQVPFRSIRIGKLGGKEDLGAGTVRRSTGEARGDALAAIEWVEWLAQFDPKEIRVEGSEWRHENFLPPLPGRGAKSVVEFEINVTQGGTGGKRIAVRGTLRIDWDLEPGDDGRPKMDAIDATEYSLTERGNVPWWENTMRIIPQSVVAGKDAMMAPVLVRDLNHDGLPEVILGGQNLLLRNKGSFNFVQEPLFVDVPRVIQSGVVEDFNGDGWLDVIGVDEKGEAWMLRGKAGGRFESAAERPWMAVVEGAGPMTAGDVDGDGDLDLWFAPYKPPYRGGQMPTPYYDANDGYEATLWINDGNGMFADGTEEAGLAGKRRRRTRSASWVDLDRDGDLDLVVVSDNAGLDLHRNDGAGKFEDVGKRLVEEGHGFGMAHAFGDFDGDGRTELYMAGRSSTAARRLDGLGMKRDGFLEHGLMRRPMNFGNRLYQTIGERLLQTDLNDSCAKAGWSWGTVAFDVENDGDEELYVANGHLSGLSVTDYASSYWRHDIYLKEGEESEELAMLLTDRFRPERMRGVDEGLISWHGYEHNRLYLNRAGAEFEEVGFLHGIGHEADCRSVVAADLDADGRQDLMVVAQRRENGEGATLSQTVLVHRNLAPQENHWLGVRLRGGNGATVQGARVMVHGEFGAREQVVVSGDSFLAQHPAVAMFGLGATKQVQKVEVFWPGGGRSVLEDVEVDGFFLVRPPKEE